MIAKVISEMDPRGYQVYSAAEPTDEEARRPLLWPFWRDLPPRGEAAVLDRSWYGRVLEQMEAEHGRAGALLESVNIFERQLGDDGYLILKFFLHISQGEQKKRLEKLSGDPGHRLAGHRPGLAAQPGLPAASGGRRPAAGGHRHAPRPLACHLERGEGGGDSGGADHHPGRPGRRRPGGGPAAGSCRPSGASPCGRSLRSPPWT